MVRGGGPTHFSAWVCIGGQKKREKKHRQHGGFVSPMGWHYFREGIELRLILMCTKLRGTASGENSRRGTNQGLASRVFNVHGHRVQDNSAPESRSR